MRRHISSNIALLLSALSVATGCVPTQPLYFGGDRDLSHYLEHAQTMDVPDLDDPRLAEVDQATSPYTLSDPEFREVWDLSLEECVAIALHNSKVIRGASPPQLVGADQINAGQDSILPAGAASFQATINVAGQVNTAYDAALAASNAGFFSTAAQIRNGVGVLPSFQQLTNQGVEAALSNFDAQLTSGINWSKTDRPVDVNPVFAGFPNVTEANTSNFNVVLSKMTATGAQFTARHTVAYNRGNQFGSLRAVPSFYTAALEMQADVPLLQGAGVQVNRVPVVVARIQADKNIAGVYANLQYALTNIEIRYWDLYFAYRRLETAKAARDSALHIWKLTKARFDGGEANSQEEAQTRQQYFQFRAQVQSALNNLYAAETNLRWLMGLAATDGRLIRPKDEPTLARVEFDGRGVIDEAVVRRPSIMQIKWEVKQREMELALARNRLLPRLNATGLYRFVGVGDQLINANRNHLDFPAVGSTAWESLTGGRFQEYQFGMTFEMPVGLRRQMAGVRYAQLNLARERAVLQELELDVSRQTSQALRAVNAHYHLAQSHFNRWVATNKEVEVLTLQVEEGVVRLDLVLEALQRRAVAMADYYASVVEYNQAIALLHMYKGSIAQYCGVQFAEGPWPMKAYWDSVGQARRRDASIYMNYGWTRPRVFSRGPVENYFGDRWQSQNGEEVPTPQPTPAEGGAEQSEELPLPEMPMPGDDVPTAGGAPLLLPPSTAAQRQSGQARQASFAVGTGVGRPGSAQGASQPAVFQWGGVSVPARGAAGVASSQQPAGFEQPAATAAPGPFPASAGAAARPMSTGGDAWQARR